LGGFFEIEKKPEELSTLIARSQTPDFWDDPQLARQVSQRINRLTQEIERFEHLKSELKDLRELLSLFTDDEASSKEVESNLSELESQLNQLELEAVFTEETDQKNAILTVHPGAGGTESCDWAEMLLRMYIRYIERRGFSYRMLDYQPGEEAGIKEACLEVLGDKAYGYLKAEAGVHRLVRISPFDANQRRHTSFAAVSVYPEVEAVAVEINPEDLKLEAFRASGHGGQNVNKVSSAVRLTHLPTGITVTCQEERSQYQNRQNALKVLRARLYKFYKEEQAEKLKKLSAQKTQIAWSHQIRSYVFFPYQLVKDHRTGVETQDITGVLDGNLDKFITSYLIQHK
jgi:peptide chain release factor 2